MILTIQDEFGRIEGAEEVDSDFCEWGDYISDLCDELGMIYSYGGWLCKASGVRVSLLFDRIVINDKTVSLTGKLKNLVGDMIIKEIKREEVSLNKRFKG